MEKIVYIYRPYFKTKDGKIIFARNYGKKAFQIPVRVDEN